MGANFCNHCGASLQDAAVPPRTATGALQANASLQGGRYVVKGLLGQGGMGAVYEAVDTRLGNKRVAIKEMSTSGLSTTEELRQAVEAFKQEAAMLARLSHRNLPRVIDNFGEGGREYLVMDLVEGQTLADLLEKRKKPFPVDQVIGWGEQLCDVLGYLHSQKPPIVFRDLKPDNIMLDRDGVVKLIDFGIARHFKPGQSSDTQAFGTAGYAPPEQYGQGQTDPRSDVYALAATMHQLLTLRDPSQDPFDFPPARSLNRSVPDGLSQALQKALANSAADRWPGTAEFRQALRAPASSPLQPTQPSAEPINVFSPGPAMAPPPPVVRPQPAVQDTRRRAGVWSYLLLVGGLTAVSVAMRQGFARAALQSVVVDPTIASILYWALIWLAPVLAYLLTRRPLAAFVTYAVGVWAGSPDFFTVDFDNPFVQDTLITAAALEAVFLLSGYRKRGTLVAVVAALAGAVSSLAIFVVRFGSRPDVAQLAVVLIAALLGGALAALLANLLRRG